MRKSKHLRKAIQEGQRHAQAMYRDLLRNVQHEERLAWDGEGINKLCAHEIATELVKRLEDTNGAQFVGEEVLAKLRRLVAKEIRARR